MASDDDPYGGGRRGWRKDPGGSASGGGGDDDEKERGDARGRGRSPASRPTGEARRRSRSRGAAGGAGASAAAAVPARAAPRAERLRWRHPDTWDRAFAESGLAGDIVDSIKAEFRRIGALRGYSMEGDQSATTRVDEATFTTTLQMHSEMCAIQATRQLLPASDAYGTASNAGAVAFATDQPHCGYCTFFLSKLGLPLSQPTKGLFNLARNCDYPLPRQLIPNLAFLANVCGIAVAALVAKLNAIYVNTGEAPAAAFESAADILKHVWRQVFAALNETLPGLR